MRFIPGQDSFSISYRGGRAFDDNFTVDFFPGRGQSVYDVDTGLQFGEYVPMVFGKSADDLSLQVNSINSSCSIFSIPMWSFIRKYRVWVIKILEPLNPHTVIS